MDTRYSKRKTKIINSVGFNKLLYLGEDEVKLELHCKFEIEIKQIIFIMELKQNRKKFPLWNSEMTNQNLHMD